jgi:uncharacterized protein YutE (UPF0331/DUF86 family)
MLKELIFKVSKCVSVTKEQIKDLWSIIYEIYTRNIIDKTVYNKLDNVRNLRNELQHEYRAIKYSSNQAQEAENAIAQVIDCLKLLKSKVVNP